MPPHAAAAKRNQATRAARGDHRCGSLWKAARILRRFTASELCAVAEYGSRASAQAWLNKLRHAGYFNSACTPGTEAMWTLVRNSGPLTPAIIRNRAAVWDFNLEREFSIK